MAFSSECRPGNLWKQMGGRVAACRRARASPATVADVAAGLAQRAVTLMVLLSLADRGDDGFHLAPSTPRSGLRVAAIWLLACSSCWCSMYLSLRALALVLWANDPVLPSKV